MIRRYWTVLTSSSWSNKKISKNIRWRWWNNAFVTNDSIDLIRHDKILTSWIVAPCIIMMNPSRSFASHGFAIEQYIFIWLFNAWCLTSRFEIALFVCLFVPHIIKIHSSQSSCNAGRMVLLFCFWKIHFQAVLLVGKWIENGIFIESSVEPKTLTKFFFKIK